MRPGPRGSGSPAREVLAFAALAVLVGLVRPDTGLAALPIQYTTKDGLRFSAHAAALFGVVANIPFFLAFLIGWMRDRLHGRGAGDGAILRAGGLALGVCYLLALLGRTGAAAFTAAIVAAGFATQFLLVPLEAWLTELGRSEKRVALYAGVIGASQALPNIASGILSGRIIRSSGVNWVLLATSGLAVISGLAASRRTGSVERVDSPRSGIGPAIVPILGWAAYAFTPAWPTAQFYFLSDRLGLSPIGYGTFVSLAAAGATAGSLAWRGLFGRFGLPGSLGTLAPLVLAGSVGWALLPASLAWLGAIVHGLAIGLGFTCFQSLAMQLCPEGAEGRVNSWMIAAGAATSSAGDLAGARAYELWGILPPAIVSLAAGLVGLAALLSVGRSVRA